MKMSYALSCALFSSLGTAAPGQEPAEHAALARIPGLCSPVPAPRGWPRATPPGTGAGFVLSDPRGGNSVLCWVPSTRTHVVSRVTVRAFDAYPTTKTPFPTELDRDSAVVWPDGGPARCVLGDFQGSGREQFCVRNRWGERYLQNGEDGQLVGGETPLLDDGTDGSWLSGRACDWNGDGKEDLAIASGHRILVLTETAGRSEAGKFLWQLDASTAAEAEDLVATAGDWDHNGLPDLILAVAGRGVLWCPNVGTTSEPKFGQPVPLWPELPGETVTGLVVYDWDRDGWLDLFVASAMPSGDQKPEFFGRELRRDLRPQQQAELDNLRLEQKKLLQRERRVALGIENPTFQDEMAISSFRGTTAFTTQNYAERIAELQWRPVPMVSAPLRLHLRKQP